MKKLQKLLLLGMLVLATYMLTGCGTTTVNLNDYVSIKTEGYDTIGTAEIVFDYDKFEDDFDGKIKRDGKEVDADRFLEKCIEGITLSQTTGLSNGDKITLEWDCDDDRAKENYNCELVYSDIEFEITDLEEVAEFNPFDHIQVSFTGLEPYGEAEITIEELDEFDYLYVSVDNRYNLSVGDVVTVTVELWYPEDFIEEFGAVVTETTKTFEVTALDAYVTSYEQIPEAFLSELSAEGEVEVKQHIEDRWDDPSTLQSITYVGNYFLSKKESEVGNALYMVYKVNATHPENEQTIEYYYFIEYTTVLLQANGECSVDMYIYTPWNTFTIDGYYYYGYQTLEELYEDAIKDYETAYNITTNIQ